MDGRLHLAAIGRRVAAAGGGVVGAMHFGDFARGVFDYAGALDEIAVAQANLASGREAEEFFGRIFAEILLLDV